MYHFTALCGESLLCFGEIQALEHLLDTPNDEIGLALMDEPLAQACRQQVRCCIGCPVMTGVVHSRQQIQICIANAGLRSVLDRPRW